MRNSVIHIGHGCKETPRCHILLEASEPVAYRLVLIISDLCCLGLELLTLDLPSPFVGRGLNRDSVIASFQDMLTAHPNIRFVVLGELFGCHMNYE